MILGEADWIALTLTLKLALWVTFSLLLLCIPLAYGFSRWQSPLKVFFESLATLPLVLPPTVLGYYLLVGFAPNSSLGQAYQTLFDQSFAFSFQGIFIASMIYSLPFAMRPIQTAFELQGKQLKEQADLLKFSPLKTFFKILLPNIQPAIISAAVLCFAHTIGEFGVILMIGGNIPGETQLLSIALFEHVETMEYGKANQLAAIMLAIAFSVVLISKWLESKGARRGI